MSRRGRPRLHSRSDVNIRLYSFVVELARSLLFASRNEIKRAKQSNALPVTSVKIILKAARFERWLI